MRLTRRGTTAIVTLARPGKHNSLTDAMWDAIPEAFAAVVADPTVLAVVLHGDGDSFCAGSDIAGLEGQAHAERPIRAEEAVAACPLPVIAAIEGHCHGGGCELAMACDIRIAGGGATFSVPPARLGIVYPVSATRRMIDLLGPAVTKELLFTAARIDADRALAVGLVNRLTPTGDALGVALGIAEDMARVSQLTIRASKAVVDGLVHDELAAETAISWVRQAAEGPDLQEGIRAFTQRRPPRFTWRG